MSELTDTAREMAEDTARAEEVLGEPLNPPAGIDPDSPAPRLSVSVPAEPTTADLVETAKRALLKRMAEMAAGDDTGIENVAEALRAIEFA